MKNATVKVLAICALASAFVLAQAQHPPDPAQMVQHHVSYLSTVLSLTSAQQQQATNIFTGAQTNQKALHDQMKSAHENLKAAIQKNDTGAIEQHAATIGNLTSQMIAAHAKAEAAFLQTLTPDQQTKYSQLESMGPGHGHGPGGMHPF